jgi:hypothetical protein
MFKVSFAHFWDSFDPEDNIFFELIQQVHPDLEIVDNNSLEIDLQIVSTFSKKYQYLTKKVLKLFNGNIVKIMNDKDFLRDTKILSFSNSAKRIIWYTGENIRPPIDSRIDGFLSFDQDDYAGQNLYFPLWHFAFREGMTKYISSHLGSHFDISDFITGRESKKVPNKFACAFIGNSEPYRLRAIESLRNFGVVDVYGKSVNKYVNDKKSIAENYKFILAFENDYFPGYVTEKLFDAYACDSIPLYWGHLGNELNINHAAFLNAANFENLEAFAAHVSRLTDFDWLSIYKEPLLLNLPNFKPVQRFLLGD